jgi:hypothetical protein
MQGLLHAAEVLYCIPLEDDLRAQTCSGSNDGGGGGLLHRKYHSEINYLANLGYFLAWFQSLQYSLKTPCSKPHVSLQVFTEL